MIQLLLNLPPAVVGFRATGEITKDDYDHTVFPNIEKHLKEGHRLNYVFVIETSLTNFTPGAWIQDAWLGLKEIAKWHKVAIVSDLEAVRKFTDTVGHLLPGEFKGFTLAHVDEAIEWAAL